MKKSFVFAIVALVLGAATFATSAYAGCYQHCHQNSNGDWVCHTNCY